MEIDLSKIDIKKDMIIIVSSIVLIILIFILLSSFKTEMPDVFFVNRLNNNSLRGEVFFNNESLGFTEGILRNPPRELCKSEAVVKLKTDYGTLEWKTTPSDCRSDKVILSYELIEERNVTFEFLEDDIALSGELFLDEVSLGNFSGSMTIPYSVCSAFSNVTILFDENYASWVYDPNLCDSTTVIRFNVVNSTEQK